MGSCISERTQGVVEQLMLTRFQTECPALYSSALAEAKRLQHGHVGVEHVVLALLSDAASPLAVALKRIGVDAATLMRAFEKEVGTGTSHSASADATPRLTAILALAAAEGELTPRALVRSLLIEGDNLFARFLVAQGVAIQKLVGVLDGAGPSESSADATRLAGRGAPTASASPATPVPPSTPSSPWAGAGARIQPKTAIPVTFPTPTLDEWGRDLRNLAEQGRLADAIGREREIEQMITVLARTQKSNPILLGEAGVGKTAIVEALAWRIAQGAVPPILRGKRVVELQMGELMSGTSLRGQFEEREVGAAAGFRVPLAPIVFGRQYLGQEAVFLFLRAEPADHRPDQPQPQDRQRGCARLPAFLFDHKQ